MGEGAVVVVVMAVGWLGGRVVVAKRREVVMVECEEGKGAAPRLYTSR